MSDQVLALSLNQEALLDDPILLTYFNRQFRSHFSLGVNPMCRGPGRPFNRQLQLRVFLQLGRGRPHRKAADLVHAWYEKVDPLACSEMNKN